MVRGKPVPVRALADDLHQKVMQYGQSILPKSGVQTTLCNYTEPSKSNHCESFKSSSLESSSSTGEHLTPLQRMYSSFLLNFKLTFIVIELISKVIINNQGVIHFHQLQEYIVEVCIYGYTICNTISYFLVL